MKCSAVRISIDVPPDLHRRLQKAAARKGRSIGELVLAGIERELAEPESPRPKRRLALDPPLIKPAGRRITISNREAYELIEFP